MLGRIAVAAAAKGDHWKTFCLLGVEQKFGQSREVTALSFSVLRSWRSPCPVDNWVPFTVRDSLHAQKCHAWNQEEKRKLRQSFWEGN